MRIRIGLTQDLVEIFGLLKAFSAASRCRLMSSARTVLRSLMECLRFRSFHDLPTVHQGSSAAIEARGLIAFPTSGRSTAISRRTWPQPLARLDDPYRDIGLGQAGNRPRSDI